MRTHSFNTSDIGNGYSNLLGPLGLGSGCGPEPIYALKDRKAKMSAWRTCMDAARIREQQKKQAKVDEKISNNALNDTLLNSSMNPPADNSASRSDGIKQPGLSMLTWGLIGVGSLGIIGVAAYFILRK